MNVMSECKACGAEIVWMKTQRDKNIPVDVPAPDDPMRDQVMEDTLFDRGRHRTHFDSCPNAKEKRTSKAAQPEPSGDSSINAKRLNIALAALVDIAAHLPDGLRSQEIAKVAVSQVRSVR